MPKIFSFFLLLGMIPLGLGLGLGLGCRSFEKEVVVDTHYAQKVYQQLDQHYPQLPPESWFQSKDPVYDSFRYPLFYAGMLAYLPVQTFIEEGPLLMGGFSGSRYGDCWSDWWYRHHLEWEDCLQKTNREGK
jgi:hypothetical protein